MSLASEIDLLLLTAVSQEYAVARPYVRNIVADGRSYRAVTGLFGRIRVALVQMGIGSARAETATQWAIDRFRPRKALLIGFSGGLDPALRPGDLVVADRALSDGGKPIPLAPIAVEGGVAGAVISSATVVESPASKRQLRQVADAIAVDMESYAVATVCSQRGVPLSVARAISDSAEDSVRRELISLVNSDGGLNLLRAMATIPLRPDLWRDVARLNRNVKAASRSLSRFLTALEATATRG